MNDPARRGDHAGGDTIDPSFRDTLSTVEYMLKRFIDDHAIERIDKVRKTPGDFVN